MRFEDLVSRFKAIQEEDFVIELDSMTAFALVSQLQLALRHPGNFGPSAAVSRNLIRQVREMFEHVDPEICRLIDLGNDPRNDSRA